MSLHFTAEAWADLARSVAEPTVEQALRAHLDTGCSDCARELEGWRAVHELARHEADYEPPEATVRLVEHWFGLLGPERVPSGIVRFLRLAFDSLRQPAPEGVRSSGQATRQLLYEADRFAVDVRIEQEPGSPRVSLVGQVLDRVDSGRRLNGIRVRLYQARTPIAPATTNDHGEFQLTFAAGTDLWLSIDVNRTTSLTMVLAGFPASLSGSS